MRFGLIGLGWAARAFHVPALKSVPGGQLVGGTDAAPDQRASFERETGIPTFASLDELFDRGNPDVIVAVLFEGGEQGKLAARLATQVIKSYVDKQRRQPTKVVEKPANDGKTEIGALWTSPDEQGDNDKLQGGRFLIGRPKRSAPLAVAAPGLGGVH